MSVRSLDGYRTSLARVLRATDTAITLRRQDAIQLNTIGLGNHVYLTIQDRMKTEVVRYDHVSDWDASDPSTIDVPVTRDVAGLGLRSFAFGTCVDSQVTSFYVRDLVAELTNSISCNAMPPPETSEASALPTTMYGGRTALLGEPEGFLELCPGIKLPFYTGG